jgi:deoxyribodipyrimidine photo-lyase
MRAIHWLRADLRLHDNTGLAAAASRSTALAVVFVLDPALLQSARVGAPRVRFLLDCLARLAASLAARGQRLVVRSGAPEDEIPRLAEACGATLVTWNRGASPFAEARDARVAAALARIGVRAESHKDDVVFDLAEVLSSEGRPYSVFTPYRNAWHGRLARDPQPPQPAPKLPPPIPELEAGALPSAEGLGLGGGLTEIPAGGEDAAARRLDAFLAGPIARYAETRDLPAVDGTSRLSPYLRFGAISIRTCVERARACGRADPAAAKGAHKWLDELVWREFYRAVLAGHPHVLRRAYRPELDAIAWNDDPAALAAWRAGETGYPIVDAGMRQLARTGWMHNRVRMIVASFLAKDLLLDWRLGEAHFQQALVDADPASNNGGWQWAASTGTDPQPYFRIFNPVAQGERFDPDGDYVRAYVPELRGVPARFVHRPWESPAPPAGYPAPIVSHAERRVLALQRYEAARAQCPVRASGPARRRPSA